MFSRIEGTWEYPARILSGHCNVPQFEPIIGIAARLPATRRNFWKFKILVDLQSGLEYKLPLHCS